MKRHIIHKRFAKKGISFDSSYFRKRSVVKYIVIHYTSGTNDTAKNEADYFATGNTRYAGAHYFVDLDGEIWQSVAMKRTAYSVGGGKQTAHGGQLYNICTNYNSVSIELCGIADKDPTEAQLDSLKWLVKHIKKYCKNANTICRHYDVNGKFCPLRFCYQPEYEKKWALLKKELQKCLE